MCERKKGHYPALLPCYYEKDTVALQRLQHPEAIRKIHNIVANLLVFPCLIFSSPGLGNKK